MTNLLGWVRRVALCLVLSILASSLAAHEVEPSVADVAVGAERIEIALRVAVEPILAGIDLDVVEDTEASPLAALHDDLRRLPPEALAEALVEAWPDLVGAITLRSGGSDLVPRLAKIDVPPVGDPELRRDSILTLVADLPPGDAPVTFGWDARLGGLIVRQIAEGGGGYDAFLAGGALTDPMPRIGPAGPGPGATALRYVTLGFDHIVPGGLDHALFVLGLFFYAFAWRPLLWQGATFTAAHSATLALATTGAISIPDGAAWMVEATIAASIVYVAIGNLLRRGSRRIGGPRIAAVFGFGLLHGLGFASVLSDIGLGEHVVTSLVAFNIGVEIAQLAVIAVAALLLGLPFGERPWYRRRVAIPASLAIAAVGTYWLLTRIGAMGDMPILA
jgi:hypothetical protein